MTDNNEPMYYVEYLIPALTYEIVHRAGPWNEKDVKYHYEDISSFTGIRDVHIVRADDV